MATMGTLGRSDLQVPRLGVGAMTWGDPKGLARVNPATLAYGGAHGYAEEKAALEASLAAGVTLFDTAAIYSNGASERRLGELARGHGVIIASKFPGTFFFRTKNMPKELDASLERLGRSSVDLYQHHFPSRSVAIPKLMDLLADAVEAGKIKAVGVSNYSAAQMRTAHAALARRGIPLASNQVEYSLLHRQPEVNGVLDAHGFGAAGGQAAIAAICTLQHGWVPPTINYTPDLAIDIPIVGNVAQGVDAHYVVVNGFGFGGHSVVLVCCRERRLMRYGPERILLPSMPSAKGRGRNSSQCGCRNLSTYA